MTETMSTRSHDPAVSVVQPSRPRWGVGVVYRCELAKLTAQWWVKAILAVCFVAPFAFALAMRMQGTEPSDTLFGRWVHDTGFASPLVVLGFASEWGFPVLVCLVAGDIFSAEDRHGTWKTILTRSRSRTDILIGKSLAAASYSVAVVVLAAAGSLISGVVLIGNQPLINFSGTAVPAGQAVVLVLLSWATALPPVLGFTALSLFFSLITRNGVAGVLGSTVIGLLMEIYAYVSGPDLIRHLLLTTPFDAWHGLMVDKPFYGPLEQGLGVCAAYVVAFMAAAYITIRRRDFTEA
jgi:ABC-2 type transport system permease protein